MTRLQLKWNAKPGSRLETQQTFPIIIYIVITFFVLDQILGSIASQLSLSSPGAIFLGSTRIIIEFAYFVYQFYVLMQTRKYLRNKYAIPATYCGENIEDLCCSLCCHCCTVAQMGRHTADYDTYSSTCCTKTGLPDHINAIL